MLNPKNLALFVINLLQLMLMIFKIAYVQINKIMFKKK